MQAGIKIKQLREERGLSLNDLADSAHLSKGYLSKIERAEKLPPFTTLHMLAQALGVEVEVFLEDHAPVGKAAASRNIDVHKRSAKPDFLDGEGYAYLPLVKMYRNKYMSPFLMKLPPGKTRSFTHDSEEFVYVISGAVEMIYEGKVYRLDEGDSFYLDSRIEHTFVNPSKKEVMLLAVSYNYRRF
jgi:transcriptional regulator with XRE-family HTH domain